MCAAPAAARGSFVRLRVPTMNRRMRRQVLDAVVFYRFSLEREEAEDQVSPVVHPARVVKAPEDWRSPRPGGLPTGPEHREASWSAVVLYCFSRIENHPCRLLPSFHARAEDSLASRDYA